VTGGGAGRPPGGGRDAHYSDIPGLARVTGPARDLAPGRDHEEDCCAVDDSVLRAMARWPDVPAVFGWLSLDRRGRFLIKGETIANRAAREFIARNYAADAQGRWYFQNGPQRVFVQLDYTPLVLRLEADGSLVDHTARTFAPLTQVCMDEAGAVLLAGPRGVGLLDDRDLDAFSARLRGARGEPLDEDEVAARLETLATGAVVALSVALADGSFAVTPVRAADVPRRFGFEPQPGP